MPDETELSSLVNRVIADQSAAWNRGNQRPIGTYLAQHPEIASDPEAVLELVRNEFRLRQGLGQSPNPTEYYRRFPHLHDALRCLFDAETAPTPGVEVADSSQSNNDPYATVIPPPGFLSTEGPANGTDGAAAQLARQLHVRCPHCNSRIDVAVDCEIENILCGSCGSAFSLVSTINETRLARGKRSIGHFDLIEQLGSGSFGTVWKARDNELDRTVAIKIPRKGQLSPFEVEQFFREARASAQLRHPNIVGIHEVGRSDDSIYIVSDFIKGATLADWVHAHPLTVHEATRLMIKVADALQHAHERGVIHRDLKPGNILLDGNGEPHVADFGLAKRSMGEITMTANGQILGTPAYMSPEQARGEGHQADAASDVYSLGVILYQLLVGQLPFQGSYAILLTDVVNRNPPKPRSIRKSIPRDLETICLKCLEKEPQHRYRSAREFGDDLQRFLDGKPIKARRTSIAIHACRSVIRHPLRNLQTLLAFLGGLAAASFFVFFLIAYLQPPPDEVWIAKQQQGEQSDLPPSPVVGLRPNPQPPLISEQPLPKVPPPDQPPIPKPQQALLPEQPLVDPREAPTIQVPTPEQISAWVDREQGIQSSASSGTTGAEATVQGSTDLGQLLPPNYGRNGDLRRNFYVQRRLTDRTSDEKSLNAALAAVPQLMRVKDQRLNLARAVHALATRSSKHIPAAVQALRAASEARESERELRALFADLLVRDFGRRLVQGTVPESISNEFLSDCQYITQHGQPPTQTSMLAVVEHLIELTKKKKVDDAEAQAFYRNVVAPFEPLAASLKNHGFFARAAGLVKNASYRNWGFTDAAGKKLTVNQKLDQLYTAAIALSNRQQPEYYLLRGNARLARKPFSLKLVLDDADALGGFDSFAARAHILSGHAHYLQSREETTGTRRLWALDAAINALRRALDIGGEQQLSDDDKATRLLLLSYSYVERGNVSAADASAVDDFLKAAEYALQAVKFLDDNAREYAYWAAGNAFEDLASRARLEMEKNYKQAIDYFEHQRRTNPESVAAQLNLGRCYYKMAAIDNIAPPGLGTLPGIISNAENALRTAIDLSEKQVHPNPETHYWLGRVMQVKHLDEDTPIRKAQQMLATDEFRAADDQLFKSVELAVMHNLSDAMLSQFVIEWAENVLLHPDFYRSDVADKNTLLARVAVRGEKLKEYSLPHTAKFDLDQEVKVLNARAKLLTDSGVAALGELDEAARDLRQMNADQASASDAKIMELRFEVFADLRPRELTNKVIEDWLNEAIWYARLPRTIIRKDPTSVLIAARNEAEKARSDVAGETLFTAFEPAWLQAAIESSPRDKRLLDWYTELLAHFQRQVRAAGANAKESAVVADRAATRLEHLIKFLDKRGRNVETDQLRAHAKHYRASAGVTPSVEAGAFRGLHRRTKEPRIGADLYDRR